MHTPNSDRQIARLHRRRVAGARASPAGLPSLAQGGDRIRSLGCPAGLHARETPRRITRETCRGRSRARRPGGSPSERVKFRPRERDYPSRSGLSCRLELAERVGLCALRAHPSLRSGPSPLRGSVLRRAARASSNPGDFVHPPPCRHPKLTVPDFRAGQASARVKFRPRARGSPGPEIRDYQLWMAERVGFEPTNTLLDITGIPVQRLRPLGHLSVRRAHSLMEPQPRRQPAR